MGKERLESPAAARSWTRIEDYLQPLQRRSAHRLPPLKPRTQPERPALLLTTLPFVALLGAMILLTAAIVVMAWPPSQPQLGAPAPVKVPELGTAPKGWFHEAQKQFH
jgi:ferric-dicitrate binding protein FerR (iron transport regulator)